MNTIEMIGSHLAEMTPFSAVKNETYSEYAQI